MGRKRKAANQWLPDGVIIRGKYYIYRHYKGCENGKPVYDKPINLGKIGVASKAEVYAKHAEVVGASSALTIRTLLDRFNESPQFRKLAVRTQKDYGRYYEILITKPIGSGVFGDVLAIKVSMGAIRKYLDKRMEEDAPIAGNKEIGYLSSAYSWAIQRDMLKMANPCIGVDKNPKNKRQHYVEDIDYYHLINCPAPAYFSIFMELQYLCRLRKSDVIKLTRGDIKAQGLLVHRGKGSKDSIIKWNDRLRAVVDACTSLPLKLTPIRQEKLPLVHDKMGAAVTLGAFDSTWKRKMAMMVANGGEHFTAHDLKRKGVSDFDGDKLKASGHRDPKMLEVYDVKVDEVESTR